VAATLSTSQSSGPLTDQIVEASSWGYNDKGEVTLATPTKSATTSSPRTASSCLGVVAS